MSDKTGIEWTDATWNPVTGCAKVSAGCKHCYVLRDWPRVSANPKTVYYGREFTDVRCHQERLDQPLRWQKPRMIFVNSMSDLFHESVPDAFIDQVFAVMALSPQHTFQVLTKRLERMREYANRYMDAATPLSAFAGWASDMANIFGGDDTDSKYEELVDCGWPLPNVWIGVSVEDQASADERIPLLLQTPAAVRWISAEPLLGAVDIRLWLGIDRRSPSADWERGGVNQGLDWVVAGGESGPHARPMHPDWAYGLRDQCAAANVPFLFKQWGEWESFGFKSSRDLPQGKRHCEWWTLDGGKWFFGSANGAHLAMVKTGKKAAGRLLDGRTWDGYPA